MAASNNVYASVAGVWQSCIPYVKVSGAWQPVQEGWTKIAGTWTQFYAAGTVALSGVNYYGNRVGASCAVYYTISGSPTCQEALTDELGGMSALGSWLVPATGAASYEVRLTATTGTFTSGTMGTWLPMTTGYTWSVVRSTPGVKQAIGTIEIRDATTLVVKATSTVDLTAERV